jgi:hypothetical protein
MRYTPLLGALGLGLGLAAAAGYQATPPPGVSDSLRAHLKDERFAIVTSIRGLPLGVREALQNLFGSGSLDIAEPGAPFRAKETDDARLPGRRMIVAGCANDQHCLLYYERGGTTPTWRVTLFQWSPSATHFEWGGAAPAGFTTVDEVRNALLSGAVKSSTEPW